MFIGELNHLLNLQASVVWDRDVLDILCHDQLPISSNKISHVPNGHRFVVADISSDLRREESVDLSLRLHLCADLFG